MTLREILPMVEGKSDGELDMFWACQDDAWERASHQLAMAHNAAVGDSSKSKSPADFNQHRQWLESQKNKRKK